MSALFTSSFTLPLYSWGQDPQEELEQMISPELSVLRVLQPDLLDVHPNHPSPHRGISYSPWNLPGSKVPVLIPYHTKVQYSAL